MLQWFYYLQKKIILFLKQKNASFGVYEFGDLDWVAALVFLTDFMLHLNIA